MKFCKDCKHYLALGLCSAPQNLGAADPVDGTRRYRYNYCSIHRTDVFIFSILNKTCGKRGRWFEYKDEVKKIDENNTK